KWKHQTGTGDRLLEASGHHTSAGGRHSIQQRTFDQQKSGANLSGQDYTGPAVRSTGPVGSANQSEHHHTRIESAFDPKTTRVRRGRSCCDGGQQTTEASGDQIALEGG